MRPLYTRRQFLRDTSAVGMGMLFPGLRRLGAEPSTKPTSPVCIARCRTYEPDLVLRELAAMMDQLGGLTKLVANKTVAVKVNLTGNVREGAVGLPAERTYHVHRSVVMATATLLDRAGARRIRFLEGTYQNGPMEDYLQAAGWDLKALAG